MEESGDSVRLLSQAEWRDKRCKQELRQTIHCSRKTTRHKGQTAKVLEETTDFRSNLQGTVLQQKCRASGSSVFSVRKTDFNWI